MSSLLKLIIIVAQILLVASDLTDPIIDTGCNTNNDCKEFEKMENIHNATCFNRQCICKDSDLKTIGCLPRKITFSNEIGGKCPCSDIKWSSCVRGFCMCQSNYTASIDNRSCVPDLVPIGSPCERDMQCYKQTNFAKCAESTCVCQPGFFFNNGTCHSIVGLEHDCESDSNCTMIPNTLCVSKQCICEPNFVAKFDKTACLPNADYNDGCVESVQCQKKLGAGAVCELEKCICGEDFVKVSWDVANETKSLCENRVAIGQLCSYDTDCFQSRYNGTEQAMYCYLTECHCADGFEEDRDSRFCVKSKLLASENTWFDFILIKVSSAFTTSSGNRHESIKYLMAIVFIGSLISFC